MSSNLVDTAEMYLKTVYELEEEDIPALRARIVERLEQSGPTVSETVARMERDGLLRVAENRHIVFTSEGRKRAAHVMRRHRIAERVLYDLIHIPLSDIHAEACRWEHVLSDEVAEKMFEVLGKPEKDPFGNPIPSDDCLFPQQDCVRVPDVESLSNFASAVAIPDGVDLENLAADVDFGKNCQIMQFVETLQAEEGEVRVLEELQILPGTKMPVLGKQDYQVYVKVPTGVFALAEQTAQGILVRAE